MKILLLILGTALIWLVVLLPWIIRTCARTGADRIIHGHLPGTEKLISRCIAILTWTNKWLTIYEEPDQSRINRLRDMLNEMQKPHG